MFLFRERFLQGIAGHPALALKLRDDVQNNEK